MILSSSVARRIGQVAWALLVVITAAAFADLIDTGCATTHAIASACRQQITPALDMKVSDALDVEAFEQELEQLVASSSLCAVDTLLERYASRSSPGAGGAAAALVNTTEALRAQRARHWLQKHPMTDGTAGSRQ